MKDTIYKNKFDQIEDFTFSQDVAEVFDDMALRSIPLYQQINELIPELIWQHCQKNNSPQVIYDLGCSTGQTLLLLSQYLKSKGQADKFHLIGIDRSSSMISQSHQKLSGEDPHIELICQDLLEGSLQTSSVIILNYTLQFFSPIDKNRLLQKVSASLCEGGLLILCEKIAYSNHFFQSFFNDLYHNLKRDNGYSQLEIDQKKKALEKVLIPIPAEGLIHLLNKNNFNQVEEFCRWYNFSGFLGIKNSCPLH